MVRVPKRLPCALNAVPKAPNTESQNPRKARDHRRIPARLIIAVRAAAVIESDELRVISDSHLSPVTCHFNEKD
jgi:hypothetical protein